MGHTHISRRDFIRIASVAAGAAMWGFPSRARAAALSKVNIAVVGTMNQAWWNIEQLMATGEEIVAICDVDSHGLGAAAQRLPKATQYRDYRILLEKEQGIDAVLVATPDHHHAPAAVRAMDLGRHCYCEKPLAHSVYEVRAMRRLAADKKLATQMGTQIHAGSNYRRVVELVRSGAIGPIKEVHIWCNKSWSDGRFGPTATCPPNLVWDLWLGPSPAIPYCEGLHPGSWRRFWDYGTGTLGDMACHHMDIAHWALDLRHPVSVRAQGPEPHAVGTPAWLIVRFEHAAAVGRGPVTVTWYDGDKRPEHLKSLKNKDGSPLSWGDGHLWIGEEGMIISDYDRHLVLADGKVVDHTPPARTIEDSIGHHAEWIRGIKEGAPTLCNFDYSGALTETVLLGNVAYRTGKEIRFDAETMACADVPEAAAFIRPPMRAGWEV